jgi:hypothetical protein
MIPGFIAAGAMGQGGGGGGTLFDEIMADSPFVYLRLGEPSGTVANNEAGATDGAYAGISLGNAALYTGGPTSMGMTATGTGNCSWPGASVPPLNALTIGLIFRANAISGIRHLVAMDKDYGASRHFQFRLNGANIDWIKIAGGVQSVSAPHGLSAGTPAMIHVTVTSGGSVKFFANGAQVGTTQAVSAVNYANAVVSALTIGNRYQENEAQNLDRFSEMFMCATAISDARVAAHAAAAGF